MTSTLSSHPPAAKKDGHGNGAGSQAAGITCHITKHNIAQLSYYDVFHLDPHTREIDTTALRREYRRYSLLFHPDKDASPEARAAFDVVAHALETLSDPALREAYDAAQHQQEHQQRQRHSADVSLRTPGSAASSLGGYFTSVEADRLQRAEEDARSAEYALRRKEQAYATQSAEAERDRQARSTAARRMLDELTHSLETPFQQMESALIDEWDMNVELLDMKIVEVEKLLAKVREVQGAEDDDEEEQRTKEWVCSAAGNACEGAEERKRSRGWHDDRADVTV